MKQADIVRVRRAVGSNVGRKVKVRANRGRRKISIAEGVIVESYPSIFTVRLDNQGDFNEQMVSFSYTDILTRDVQLLLCN